MTWKDLIIGGFIGFLLVAVGVLAYRHWRIEQQMEILLKLPWER